MWTFERMTIREKGSPANFCHLMNEIYSDLSTEKTLITIYVDDILCISAHSDALRWLELVFESLEKKQSCFSLTKCNFFQKELNFWGMNF